MTSEERLTASRPEDVLGFIPHALGYWPQESLVAMTLQGKALGATLRVDLPFAGDQGALELFASRISDYLAADDGADGCLLAVFTDRGWEDLSVTGSHLPLLDALGKALPQGGLEVREAWLVGSTYWRSAYCIDSSCCPSPGRPTTLIQDSRLNAEMVYRGSSIQEPPDTPTAASPTTGGPAAGRLDARESEHTADRCAVLEAEQDFVRELRPWWRNRECFETVLCAWQDVLELFREFPVSEAPAPTVLDPEVRGFLRATLQVPSWRDAVVVMAAAGSAAARGGAEAFGLLGDDGPCPLRLPDGLGEKSAKQRQGGTPPLNSSPPNSSIPNSSLPPMPNSSVSPNSSMPNTAERVSQERFGWAAGDVEAMMAITPSPLTGYGDVLLGLEPSIPDWRGMAALEHILQMLGASGEGEAAAAAFTLRGWIEWCRGRGSFAGALFRDAERIYPGYRLAELLDELLRRGTVCGWAQRREAAWRRFGETAA
jgi:hypothetical protein